MILYIRNKKFEVVKIISTATSVVWLKKTREEGQCAFTIPITADLIPYVNIDYYITRPDDEMVCQIKKITIKTNEDTKENYYEVISIDKLYMLKQRVTLTLKNYTNKNVEELIRELIDENFINTTTNRKINIAFDSPIGFKDVITTEIKEGTNVFEEIKKLCDAYDYCMKLTREGTNWKFTLYEGNNYSFEQSKNTYIEFSERFHNLRTTNYTCDKSGFTNTAITNTETINDDNTGEDRYEIHVGDNTSDEAKNNLTGLVENFTGEIINTRLYMFRKDYNVGDIITIRNSLGIQVSARIIQVNEAYDINGTTITPSFEQRKIGG